MIDQLEAAVKQEVGRLIKRVAEDIVAQAKHRMNEDFDSQAVGFIAGLEVLATKWAKVERREHSLVVTFNIPDIKLGLEAKWTQ